MYELTYQPIVLEKWVKSHDTDGFGVERHLTNHMGHKNGTGIKRYDNRRSIMRGVAANVAQKSVPREAAVEEITSYDLPQAMDHPGMFAETVAKRKGDLPWENDLRLFLVQHAKGKEKVGNLRCTGTNCTCSFHFSGDLINHMVECDKGPFSCPFGCGNSGIDTTKTLKWHISICKSKPVNFRRDAKQKKREEKLDFMTHLKCQYCGKGLPRQVQLTKHVKENCKAAKAANAADAGTGDADSKPAAKKSAPAAKKSVSSLKGKKNDKENCAPGRRGRKRVKVGILADLSDLTNDDNSPAEVTPPPPPSGTPSSHSPRRKSARKNISRVATYNEASDDSSDEELDE